MFLISDLERRFLLKILPISKKKEYLNKNFFLFDNVLLAINSQPSVCCYFANIFLKDNS